MNANISYGNNTCSDISAFHKYFVEASKSGVLPDELADLFKITLLVGFNPDGSSRLIVDAA